MIGGGVMKRKIIFQALDWRLKDIKNNLKEIKKAGFNNLLAYEPQVVLPVCIWIREVKSVPSGNLAVSVRG